MQSAWRLLSRKYSPIVTPVYGAMYCSGAGSERRGDDHRRVGHGPGVLEHFTTWATVERFWPTAT